MDTPEPLANVDVKQAIETATAYLVDLFPEAKNIRLEEAELIGIEWNVVLSFPSGQSALTLASLVTGATTRLYKLVTINRETGEAVALKVWKP